MTIYHLCYFYEIAFPGNNKYLARPQMCRAESPSPLALFYEQTKAVTEILPYAFVTSFDALYSRAHSSVLLYSRPQIQAYHSPLCARQISDYPAEGRWKLLY